MLEQVTRVDAMRRVDYRVIEAGPLLRVVLQKMLDGMLRNGLKPYAEQVAEAD
ncbi:MAG: hypothetical protein R3E50_09030 [Halioglobus sp.]